VKRKKSNSTLAFSARYERRLPALKRIASIAEAAIWDALEPLNLELHHIGARAKELPSAVAKVRRKRYGRPLQQLTDQVGVRVIVYYPEDVDTTAARLRSSFDVNERQSIDKRRELQTRQFGYRSLHLLLRLGKQLPIDLANDFGKMWIEVQVRSVLEHAWAEIEHEIVYKAGTSFPELLLRRFSALAGTLEILDTQFSSLRVERETLINSMVREYSDGSGLEKTLDGARLIALLEAVRPNGLGWRVSGIRGRRFTPNSDVACTDALASAGIRTGKALIEVVKGATCRQLIRRFAAEVGVEPAQVSHLALSVLACATKSPSVLAHYPDLLGDSRLRSALKSHTGIGKVFASIDSLLPRIAEA
jgi:ppGpp synthetase/RelA/SpoT-type nucleotidyltranferase